MLSISAITILCFIFGSIIGSFLGVCAYRIPMGRYEPVHAGVKELAHQISITNPRRSFCPQCEMQLLWWHNIPLLSWLFLRGRFVCYSSRSILRCKHSNEYEFATQIFQMLFSRSRSGLQLLFVSNYGPFKRIL